MTSATRLRAWLTFLLWLGATYVIALLPLHVEAIQSGVQARHFDESRALATVTILYIALAVTVSTLPANVTWAFAEPRVSASTYVAIALGVVLIFGMVILGVAVAVASSSQDLSKPIQLGSSYGQAMCGVLVSSLITCTLINTAALIKDR